MSTINTTVSKSRMMEYTDNYYEISASTGYKTIIYGAGYYGTMMFPYLKNVACYCDQNAESINKIKDIDVITVEQLKQINENFIIVICIKSGEERRKVKEILRDMEIPAMIFDLFDNTSFKIYNDTAEEKKDSKPLRHIHLIYRDTGWILEKFVSVMQKILTEKGYTCTAGDAVCPSADINHHIIHLTCNPPVESNETFMITHIESLSSLKSIKFQLNKVKMGICMSRETMERLISYGVPREKICYINPAQDGVIKPKKYVLGITSRVYEDNRKNIQILVDLCKKIDPDYFSFKIMGAGWNDIVHSIKQLGFEIDYYSDFDYDTYTKLIPSLDYYLYWGYDEGSMGYLDALRAGVETIVTPQGFHLDVQDGITYPCRTYDDFLNTLLGLQERRRKRIKSVEDWTWENFTKKHIDVWNYLLGNETEFFDDQLKYVDGIYSALI